MGSTTGNGPRYLSMFHSSANWYCSQVSDISLDNIFAFGSKFSITLLDINTRKFIGTLIAHTNRVSGVCFNKHLKFSNLCVSVSADKSVRVWDVSTLTPISHHSLHKHEVLAVSQSPLVVDLIVSGDTDGKIVVWRNISDEKHILSPPQDGSVYTIACSPANPDEAAIGYQNGTLIILNIASGSIVHKLSGHVDEVQIVTWSLNLRSFVEFTPTTDHNNTAVGRYYLASASRDKSIRIWEGWDTYRGYKVFQLPKAALHLSEQQKGRLWLTVDWSTQNPTMLVSSSHAGDILMWNILEKTPSPKKFAAAGGHTRSVFALRHSPSNPTQLISFSLDRQIILWDADAMRALWRIPGLGGFVYCMDISPLDPMRIALAVGDKSIHIWVINSENPYESTLLWKGIQAKVTAVAYHPIDVGILGYGLDDGRIAIVDTSKLNFLGVIEELYMRFHGEFPNCGEGIVLEWNPNDPQQNGKNINAHIETANPAILASGSKKKFPARSDITWRADGEYFLLGNSDGSIELYSSEFLLLKRFHDHRKLINRIRWNPASDDGTIRVYDVTSILTGSNKTSDIGISGSSECLQVLKGHEQQVSSLSWSAHDPTLLLSGSFDTTAQVWNAFTGAAVSNMKGHEQRVFSVAWSPIMPNIVFSAGEDQTARKWDYTNQPDCAPPGSSKGSLLAKQYKKERIDKRVKVKELEKQSDSPLELTPAPLSTPVLSVSSDLPAELVPVASEKKEIEPATAQHEKKEALAPPKAKKSKSAVPLVADIENLEIWRNGCIVLAQNLYGNHPNKISAESDLAMFLVNQAQQTHVSSQNWDPYLSLEMWRGNIGHALQTVVKEGLLDANWVALSVLAGKDVWESMMGLYARMLEEKGQYHMAAMYLLACHKFREAIDVYRRASLFRDAILLAKTRLSPEDPLIPELMLSWAGHLEKNFKFEQAAVCYLAGGQPSEAIIMLSSRAGPEFLSLASRVAHSCSKGSMSPSTPSVKSLAIVSGMREQVFERWDQALNEYKLHEDLREYIVVLSVEQGWRLNILPTTDSDDHIPQFGTCVGVVMIAINKFHSAIRNYNDLFGAHDSYFKYVLRTLLSRKIGSFDDISEISEIYVRVKAMDLNQLRKEKQVQFSVSLQISLLVLAVLMNERRNAVVHFTNAVNSFYVEENFAEMNKLYETFFPVDPQEFGTIISRLRTDEYLDIVESLISFHKFNQLTNGINSDVSPELSVHQMDDFVRDFKETLLTERHTAVPKLEIMVHEMSYKLSELELSIKNADIAERVQKNSKKKNKKGESTANKEKKVKKADLISELKHELSSQQRMLQLVVTQLNNSKSKPPLPDAQRSCRIIAELCQKHNYNTSSLVSWGITHAYDEKQKSFWESFGSNNINNNNPLGSNESVHIEQQHCIEEKVGVSTDI